MDPFSVVRIKCKPGFLSVLQKDGYTVEAVPNTSLATVKLPLLRTGSADEPDEYVVPPFANPEFVLIQTMERRMGDTGAAQTVCRLSGSALWPYRIVPGIVFFVPKQVAVVKTWPYSKRIIVEAFFLRTEGLIASIKKETLYDGSSRRLVDRYARFLPAAEAARAKSLCRACTHVHYMAGS